MQHLLLFTKAIKYIPETFQDIALSFSKLCHKI